MMAMLELTIAREATDASGALTRAGKDHT